MSKPGPEPISVSRPYKSFITQNLTLMNSVYKTLIRSKHFLPSFRCVFSRKRLLRFSGLDCVHF